MVNPSCFVPYCQSRSEQRKSGKKISTFGVPKNNEDLYQLWKRKLPRDGFEKTNRVCEKHFDESDIIRYNETILKDGTIHRIKLDCPYLKPDAVPRIFPNLPSYLTTEKKSRKPPKERVITVSLTEFSNEKLQSSSNKSNTSSTTFSSSDCNSRDSEQSLRYNHVTLSQDLERVKTNWPDWFWSDTKYQGEELILFIHFGTSGLLDKYIRVKKADLSVKGFFTTLNKPIQHLPIEVIRCQTDIFEVLKFVNDLKHCPGPGPEFIDKFCVCKKKMHICHETVYVTSRRRQRARCAPCQKIRDSQHHKKKNEIKKSALTRKKNHKLTILGRRNLLLRRKSIRLKTKVINLREHLEKMQKECAKKSLAEVVQSYPNLDEAQRICIANMLQKSKSKYGRRYTTEWIYECILLRIKSRKGYEHLLRHKILVLPSLMTINRYLRKIKPIYGFCMEILELMKRKSNDMSEEERRGVIIFDEMKLTSSLSFVKSQLETIGFVTVGEKVGELADHTLVFLFQPFRGKWLRCFGSFLTKGAAKGGELYTLVIEAITLLEKNGYFVDALVSDGATWNRNMWSRFGVTEERVSCPHVVDDSRRLWFISDFSHLLKNMRNSLVARPTFWTPDGEFKIAHLQELVQINQDSPYQLKVALKLTSVHIDPTNFDKMNVGLALQFFGLDVIAGLDYLKDYENVNCEATIDLIKLINKIITAMTAKTPASGLSEESENLKTVREFLAYFNDWKKRAKEQKKPFFSDNTTFGVQVSLRGVLELSEFLFGLGWQSLMTGRLLQDRLERFFSIIRSCCGCNDSPDPIMFIQLFRLLASYSVFKPIPGSNVESSEYFKTLIGRSVFAENGNVQIKPKAVINMSTDVNNCSAASKKQDMDLDTILAQQMYGLTLNIDVSRKELVAYYMAGFITTKSNLSSCVNCLETLKGTEKDDPRRNGLIVMRNNSRKSLKFPSCALANLISLLEDVILDTIGECGFKIDTFSEIMEKISWLCMTDNEVVGCSAHKVPFTESIIQRYIIIRMNFLCDDHVKEKLLKKQKAVKHKKLSKIVR